MATKNTKSAKPNRPRRFAEARGYADTFEMAASYADGRHYVETSTSELDALLSAKEHIEQPKCDYVRIMRQRQYPHNAAHKPSGDNPR